MCYSPQLEAILSQRHGLVEIACYCLHFCLWLENSTLLFYSELKRQSLFNQNIFDFLYTASTYVIYVSLPVIIVQ